MFKSASCLEVPSRHPPHALPQTAPSPPSGPRRQTQTRDPDRMDTFQEPPPSPRLNREPEQDMGSDTVPFCTATHQCVGAKSFVQIFLGHLLGSAFVVALCV